MDKDRINFRRRERYRKNPTLNLKRQKSYRETFKEKHREYSKNYRDSLPVLVYRFRDGFGVVDWVGHGTIIRVRQHKYKSPWWTSDHTYSFMVCRNEWHAMKLEGIWGELFRPRYNKEGYRHGTGK